MPRIYVFWAPIRKRGPLTWELAVLTGKRRRIWTGVDQESTLRGGQREGGVLPRGLIRWKWGRRKEEARRALGLLPRRRLCRRGRPRELARSSLETLS